MWRMKPDITLLCQMVIYLKWPCHMVSTCWLTLDTFLVTQCVDQHTSAVTKGFWVRCKTSLRKCLIMPLWQYRHNNRFHLDFKVFLLVSVLEWFLLLAFHICWHSCGRKWGDFHFLKKRQLWEHLYIPKPNKTERNGTTSYELTQIHTPHPPLQPCFIMQSVSSSQLWAEGMIVESIAGYYTVPVLLRLKITSEVMRGEKAAALKAKAENAFV